MVYRAKGKQVYQMRVSAPDGRQATLSTGYAVKEDADEVEALVRRFAGEKGQRYARPDVLRLLVQKVKGFTLRAVFDAHHDGTLDALVARATALATTTDLRPHLDAWQAAKQASRKGAVSAPKYRTQVERLYDDAPLTTATFTRDELLERLDALPVADPTRNRYKAAASSFGKYLVRARVIPTNPVRDIEGWSEGAARTVFYERQQAQQIIAALPQPFAAIAALMCGAGLEWESVEKLRARDVDEVAATVHCRADKYRTRTRTTRVLKENAWTWAYIRPALDGKVGDALVFPGITDDTALRRHRRAVKAVGAARSTNHDWRHTHAVQALRDGYSPQVVAHQLGHATAWLVITRYGVFVPQLADYVPDALRTARTEADEPNRAATDSATPLMRRMK